MPYTVAIDEGGTFTDVVVACPDRRLLVDKADTVPSSMFTGASVALTRIAEDLGVTLRGMLAETAIAFYGTTRATNAIIERTTAKRRSSRPRDIRTSSPYVKAESLSHSTSGARTRNHTSSVA